jgi:hypothetical protein
VSVAAAVAAAPGTPPVTLIESSLESSVLDGCGADAAAGGAELPGVLRIESPTVPVVEPIGALTPS